MIRERCWDVWEWFGSLRRELPRHAVYHWGDWHRSYPKYVIPAALRVHARIGESVQDIFDRLPVGLESFLFHLDLSNTRRFIPDRDALLSELRRREITPLNGGIADITSRTIQSLLRQAGLPDVMAQPDGDREETLIVKSNYNYGGRSERMLSTQQREQLDLTNVPEAIRKKRDYFLVRRKDLPRSAWDDLSIQVERYVSNHEGRLFRFRVCLDRWAVSSCVTDQPVKDFQFGHDFREELILRGSYESSLPRTALAQAYRIAEVIGLDFGALDAIIDDEGICYVVDVNTTPGISQVKGPRIDFMRQAWRNVGKAVLV